ncbi:MAG: histidine kinase [Gammaproteobacteria bacterium]|nr:MAG: histidine kinase [Gammaproteobacteria bacterium]
MKAFLFAQSADKPVDQLLDDCLRQLGDIPPEATLGFLYATDHLGEQLLQIVQQLRETTGVQNWVGSLGMGLIASHNEYYDTPAMAMMIADFNEDDYRLLPNFTRNTRDLEQHSAWCQQHDFHVGLVHADPENPAIQNLMADLGQQIPQAFLVGGITSSRGKHYQIANDVIQGGLSGILFSDQLNIITNLTQGCTPMGSRHRVTLADRNIVYTLDHQPALDVLIEEVGELMARDWERASNFIFTGLVNPNRDTDDYTVRQLIGVDEHAKIFAIGDYVENGQEIVFCRRDGSSATDDMQRMLLQMKSRIKSPPRGGIYVSCLGRGREQFGSNSEEVRMIHAALGDFPLVGFFANGEIHNNRLYGFTGVLTLFL